MILFLDPRLLVHRFWTKESWHFSNPIVFMPRKAIKGPDILFQIISVLWMEREKKRKKTHMNCMCLMWKNPAKRSSSNIKCLCKSNAANSTFKWIRSLSKIVAFWINYENHCAVYIYAMEWCKTIEMLCCTSDERIVSTPNWHHAIRHSTPSTTNRGFNTFRAILHDLENFVLIHILKSRMVHPGNYREL